MEIKVFDSAVEVSHFMALEVINQLERKKDLVLGLATGRTMDAIYHHLVNKSIAQNLDYSKVKAFAVDEYIGLDKHNEFSFEFYLNLHLFNQLNFQKENIYIPKTELSNIDETCLEFEQTLSDLGGIDLQLLGIGMNGHIGLNEPGSGLDSRSRIVGITSTTRQSNRALFKSELAPATAVTMGVGTIMDSKSCYLIATGETKADIIQRLVNGDVSSKIPASAVKGHKNSYLLLDKEAARLI